MPEEERLVVLGGNDAGLSCVLGARRAGDERPITVIEKNPYLGHAHCDLPYVAGEQKIDRSELIHQDPGEFGEKYKVDFKMGSRVTEVNTTRRQVIYESSAGERKEISYGKLLISTGAEPIVPASFSASEELHTISRIEGLERLNSELKKSEPVFIIGGGTVGVETADTLAERGYKVGLIEARRLVLPYSTRTADRLEERLQSAGVRVFSGEAVEDVKQAGGQFQLITSTRTHRAGTVIAALGVRPVTGYVDDPSLTKNDAGALTVDNRMRTGVPGVYAAGDVIRRQQFDGERELWPVASAASHDGWTAGLNIAGNSYSRSAGVRRLGFSISGDRSYARMGVLPDQLPDSATWVETSSRLRFLDEWRQVNVCVAVDRKDNSLLAGEIEADLNLAGFLLSPLGPMLQKRANVSELAGLEATYHPKLNSMNHPLAIPARKYIQ